MRKIVYWVHVSLDGHINGPNGEFNWPYQVVVHPVVLGGGRQLFPQANRFSLNLVETRTFDGAAVLLRCTR